MQDTRLQGGGADLLGAVEPWNHLLGTCPSSRHVPFSVPSHVHWAPNEPSQRTVTGKPGARPGGRGPRGAGGGLGIAPRGPFCSGCQHSPGTRLVQTGYKYMGVLGRPAPGTWTWSEVKGTPRVLSDADWISSRVSNVTPREVGWLWAVLGTFWSRSGSTVLVWSCPLQEWALSTCYRRQGPPAPGQG